MANGRFNLTLRLRHLRLRAATTAGLYGTDIPFGLGLNVIWADNTKGKSTCTQAMLYALGLERMLSPRREIPLPYAMTSFLRNDDESQHSVLESHVSLEIQNGAGQIVTVTRPIKSTIDGRLISVNFGPTLTDEAVPALRRNFFVLDPGAASREDGFHRFLEDFLGWELPTVKRYDGPDAKLYLETIFPLFWVEQKTGWSSIPAAIPTYFRIRDVHKRAVEFLMNLEVHQLELRRQQIDEAIADNAQSWRNLWEEVERLVRRAGGRVEALPQKPTTLTSDLSQADIFIAEGVSWVPLRDVLSRLRGRLADLENVNIPAVGETSDALTSELEALSRDVEQINSARINIHRAKQLKKADIDSLRRRIKALSDDLQKNQDVQKLQRFSGTLADLTPDRCPTCEQSLVDTLLGQEVLSAVMPIEDNIEYLRSQLKMFEDILRRENADLQNLEQDGAVKDRDLADLYSRIRTIKSDLVSAAGTPSAAAIEERVRAESRIRDLEGVRAAFDDTLDRMQALAQVYAGLLSERSDLPSDTISASDREKIDILTTSIQEQARAYGFTTFDPREINVAEENYRPQKEGFEIGFETSASDAIRLKWAYQLGLLELAVQKLTSHPGMLLFDEPRQQSSSKISFRKLLQRASEARRRKQQVIFSTSEDLDSLKQIIAGIDHSEHIFSGYVIQPLQS